MKNLLKAFGTLTVVAFFVMGLAYNIDYTTIQIETADATSEIAGPGKVKVTCPKSGRCTTVKGQPFEGVPTFEF